MAIVKFYNMETNINELYNIKWQYTSIQMNKYMETYIHTKKRKCHKTIPL